MAEMDGRMLAELANLSFYHKDAFYILLSTKTPGIDLVNILRFGKVVQKLIENQL